MKIKLVLALALCASSLLAAEEARRPRIIGVAHMALWVHDLEKSRQFYKDFLGFDEPFSLPNTNGSVQLTFIKINDRQYLELFPERTANSDRLYHISVETDNAEAMRTWFASHGIKAPDKVGKGRIGNLNFNVTDPDGHILETVEYAPDGWSLRDQGKFLPDTRISTRIMHLGIIVTNLDAAMRFYGGALGFQETWRGSRDTNRLSWVNLKVPDGEDYLEFMLYHEPPDPNQRGTAHHVCLEVPDIEESKAILEPRAARIGYTRPLEIRTGINRRRQLNLYDPDGTRIELMEPKTVDGVPAPSSTAPF